ncbi:MAG: FtsQ-type POTRA domain-containing protein [Deltaproteobacteria bacterium]|nr:FtsQ-type POTRA domain-containing protein [Deltaproteobacteria bacterium]
MKKPLPRSRSSLTGRADQSTSVWSRIRGRMSRRRPAPRRFSMANQTVDQKRKKRSEREDSIRGQRPVSRSSVTPRQRAVAVSGIAIVAGSSAMFAIGSREVHHYLRSSEDFAIREIRVTGIERASEDEVLALADVRSGLNYFSVDESEIAARVSSHAWIKSVSVQRELPHGVSIDVEEHVPVAMAALGHLYYVTKEGEVVKRRTSLDGETFPIITGLSKEKLESGDERERQRLLVGISFVIDRTRVLGVDSSPLAEVHVDEMNAVTFVAANDRTRVFAGSPPWGERLQRVSRVRAELADRGLVAEEMALGSGRRAERVVARLARVEEDKAKDKKRAGNGVSARTSAPARVESTAASSSTNGMIPASAGHR